MDFLIWILWSSLSFVDIEINHYIELSKQFWAVGSLTEPTHTLSEQDLQIGRGLNIHDKPTPGALKKPSFLPKSGSKVHFIPIDEDSIPYSALVP
jgi:hypothetical protein